VASGTSQTRQSTVTALAFDPFEELLWSATRDGRITCHHSQTLERYVSFMAHKAPVLKLVPIANGMSSVSTKGVRLVGVCFVVLNRSQIFVALDFTRGEGFFKANSPEKTLPSDVAVSHTKRWFF